MLTQERYKYILDLLKENHSVKVLNLSKELNVSVDTIRRDLKHLESKRHLVRTHGGAVLYDLDYQNKSIPERMKMMTSSKVNLGKEIIDELNDGDVLFLDGSTTTILMIPSLSHLKQLTIITNSMYTGLEVLEKKLDATLHLLGGKVLNPIGTVIGIEALYALKSYKINKAILSSYAVDASGFYDLDADEARFKRELIDAVSQVYFLMDRSKVHVQAPMFISEMKEHITLVLEEDYFHVNVGRLITKK